MIIKDILSHKNVLSQGKLMALDVGMKRIGVAMSDEGRFLATPKLIIEREGDFKDLAKIAEIALESKISGIVVGFPINMDGSLNEMSEFARNFIIKLDEVFLQKMPIFPADERLSTFEAKELMREVPSRKGKKYCDDIAASVILQDFIDRL